MLDAIPTSVGHANDESGTRSIVVTFVPHLPQENATISESHLPSFSKKKAQEKMLYLIKSVPVTRQKWLTELLLKMISSVLKPFSAVRDKGFK